MNLAKYISFNMHKEGVPFIITAMIIAVILYVSTDTILYGAIVIAACALFFRDPERVTLYKPGLVIAAADGIITNIEEINPSEDFGFDNGEKMLRISTFLSVFDVHVNRMPVKGYVTKTHYHKGKFLNAQFDKSSDENERQLISIKSEDGLNIGVVQIAGLIAKRIVCDINANDKVEAGDRFGIIRFGSRVDVYVPLNSHLNVAVGQRMIGGETVIATLDTAASVKKLKTEKKAGAS